MNDLLNETRNELEGKVKLTRNQYEKFRDISDSIEDGNSTQLSIVDDLEMTREKMYYYCRIFISNGLIEDQNPEGRSRDYSITERGREVLEGNFELKDLDYEKIYRCYKEVRKAGKVANEFDITKQRVRQIVIGRGGKLRHGLLKEEVKPAIELYKNELSYDPILAKYDISRRQFKDILNEEREPLLDELLSQKLHQKILETWEENPDYSQEKIASVVGTEQQIVSDHLRVEGIKERERHWERIPPDKEEKITNLARENIEKPPEERITQAEIAEMTEAKNQSHVSQILKRNNVKWVGPGVD